MIKMKNKKGITLIALIITIIVLLILVGVSIETIIGENGLIERARNAKEVTDNATNEEKGKLSSYENEIDNYNIIGRSGEGTNKNAFEILETGSYTSSTIPKNTFIYYTVPLENNYSEEQQAKFLITSDITNTGVIAPYFRMDEYAQSVVGNNHTFYIYNAAGTGSRRFYKF